jgi:long-chain acyl-CoA synthetase
VPRRLHNDVMSDEHVMGDENDVEPERPDTIVHRFRARAARQPRRTAMRHIVDGRWATLTWSDYATAVDETAVGLMALGIEPGDRVAILAGNRPEWHIADLAIMSAGAITVPVYPTSSSSQVAYVLDNSDARVCFVDDAEQLAKVLLHLGNLPTLEHIVMIAAADGLDRPGLLISLTELRSRIDSTSVLEARVEALGPGDLATLVYTSGTTGPPKGVSITHGNICWTLDSVESIIGLSENDRLLSYLPLSHIAERVTSHFGMIQAGGETWFAQSLATVADDLRACRPTIFMAVPRVWQKLHDAIVEQVDAKPLHLGGLLDRLVGVNADPDQPAGSPRAAATHAAAVAANRAVGRAVRRGLGLDHARLVVSAAAPIHPDLVRWFHGLGLPIAEVYGQTEDCGPATLNPPDAIRIGSVGRPIPGLEIRVATDGELLVRGGSVCAGYFQMPEATAELIDDAGWMATGDLGRIDDDGYVWLTGRKKDLIINAAGKNIAPSEIESRLSMEKFVGQAVVIGDGRRYLTALVTLDADAAAEWAEHHGASSDIADLIGDSRIRGEIAAAVERVNHEHAPVEQIKYWRLLPTPLTVEGGELTPTYKVKRAVVAERYADLIETMYAT